MCAHRTIVTSCAYHEYAAAAGGVTSLVAHELGRAQLRCFAAGEYLRDRGTPRRHATCFGTTASSSTPLTPRGRWTFRSRGRTVQVPVRGRLVENSIPLALDAALRGLGIVRVPGALVAEGLAAKQLVEVLDIYAPPPRPAPGRRSVGSDEIQCSAR